MERKKEGRKGKKECGVTFGEKKSMSVVEQLKKEEKNEIVRWEDGEVEPGFVDLVLTSP